jgi:membrane protease YdiL (CAAX protease family)
MPPPPLPPRWPLGSLARVLHALALWVGFLVGCHVTRLAPSLGGLKYVVSAFLVYGVLYGHFMLRVGRVRLADLGITRAGWRREIGLGLVAMLGITATLRGIVSIPLADRLPLFVIGVLAASAEDTLFRGYLQPALIARWGTAAGLLLTMALFQVHHYLDWPTVHRVGALVITGLGFGIPRWRDRPLIASYTAHIALWTLWGYY